MSVKVHINGDEVLLKSFNFSAGEVHVRLGEFPESQEYDVFILANLHSSNDIMELLMVVDAIRRMFVGQRYEISTLVIPYLPYSRQDRVCNDGEAFGLKVFGDLINSIGASSVITFDAHSDVAGAVINNLMNLPLYNTGIATTLNVLLDLYNTVIVSPDAGANKKIFKFAQETGFANVVRADKIRNVETGEIVDTQVYTNHVGTKDFLIVDDICDGGRTFIELAKKLRELTDGKIYLLVTHGIFSKGLEVFEGVIDGIFVVNLVNFEIPENNKLLKVIYER